MELIKEVIVDVNSKIQEIGGDGCPKIKKYTILHKEFSMRAGEMTRAHKLRREMVFENYFMDSDRMILPLA